MNAPHHVDKIRGDGNWFIVTSVLWMKVESQFQMTGTYMQNLFEHLSK